MSSTTNSPDATPIQPLHNPSQAAQQASQAPGMGAKALLAKKMANNANPAFISPTDNMMTPCTQKLSAAKKKHFTKSAKPVQLFGSMQQHPGDADEEETTSLEHKENPLLVHDDENPF